MITYKVTVTNTETDESNTSHTIPLDVWLKLVDEGRIDDLKKLHREGTL